MKGDSTPNWDATGAYLLAYAMPLKQISLTGKRDGKVPQLDAAEAKQIVLDGRGWSNKDRNSAYDKLSGDELFERLSHWSPVVRERAGIAITRRKDASVDALVKLLESKDLHTRLGACRAIALLKGKSSPAVTALRAALQDKDYWLRISATEARGLKAKPMNTWAGKEKVTAVAVALKGWACFRPGSEAIRIMSRRLRYRMAPTMCQPGSGGVCHEST